MTTLGAQALTLSDLRKRLAPDGSVDFIIEALLNSNPFMDDITWKEGNLPTGNRTTIRASMPTPSVRRINRGITAHKTTTKQVQDTCIILEDRSCIDIEELSLAPNPQEFRKSEDAAFVGGFSDAIAANAFYGDSEEDMDNFNGLSTRYSLIGGEKNTAAHQTLAGGTAAGTEANTSAFFVGWGTHATTGIYPRNSKAGLSQRDLGEADALDKDNQPYRALTTLFTWKAGLSVGDIRANALVRTIDTTKLESMTSAQKLALVEQFIHAKNRSRNLQSKDKKVMLYVSDMLYDFFEIYLLDKNNVHVTRQDVMNDVPRLFLSGIEIKKCDAISNKEKAVPVKS